MFSVDVGYLRSQSITILNQMLFRLPLVPYWSTGYASFHQFVDDSKCSALSCLSSEPGPTKIIKPSKQLSPETERVLMRYSRSPLVNELVLLLEFWDAKKRMKSRLYTGASMVKQSLHLWMKQFHMLLIPRLKKLAWTGYQIFGASLWMLARMACMHFQLLEALFSTWSRIFWMSHCLDLRNLSNFHALVSVIMQKP